MTKNIAVIDEQGNRYEATYLKRAKGLVKSGRARFVDEKTICLARPPDKSEDKTMSENMGSINYSSEDLNAKNPNAEKANFEGLGALESLSAESLNTTNPDSQGPEDLSSVEELKKRATAYVDAAKSSTEELKKKATVYVDAAKSSTEELKKSIIAYLAAAQPKHDEGLEKSGEAQGKTGEGQEKQPQEKALSREIVERVLEQLDHFAADDAYIGKLAEENFDSEDMTNIVGLREATRQRHLEVYKTVLLKALENEANARTSAFKQLQMVADWMADLDRSNYDENLWQLLTNKVFELMDSIRTVAVTDTIR